MTKRVYKYEIPESNRFAIKMNEGAEFLHVGIQRDATRGDVAFMWLVVDLEKPLELRKFFIVPTGVDLPLDKDGDFPYYLASFQLGRYVWHLFEPYEDQIYPQSETQSSG